MINNDKKKRKKKKERNKNKPFNLIHFASLIKWVLWNRRGKEVKRWRYIIKGQFGMFFGDENKTLSFLSLPCNSAFFFLFICFLFFVGGVYFLFCFLLMKWSKIKFSLMMRTIYEGCSAYRCREKKENKMHEDNVSGIAKEWTFQHMVLKLKKSKLGERIT